MMLMGKFRGQYTNTWGEKQYTYTWGEGAEKGGWLEKRPPVVTPAMRALYHVHLPIVPQPVSYPTGCIPCNAIGTL